MSNSEFRETYGANPTCKHRCEEFCKFWSDLESASRLPRRKQLDKVEAFNPTPRHEGYVNCANGFGEVLQIATNELNFSPESKARLEQIKAKFE